MDEDENISMIISMGFTNIDEVKRALRIAKNDVNEAVSVLMDQPLTSYGTVDDLSLDYDMKYAGGSSGGGGEGRSSNQNESAGTGGDEGQMSGGEGGGSNLEFPVASLYELEGRVFLDNWSIPYKREESLGRCLEAATRLAQEGLMEQDDHCRKFTERVMPEAFRKLLTSNAIQRWSPDIQEGIRLMCELFVDLVITRLRHGGEVPCQLLQTLTLVFDMKSDWNNKHRDQPAARGSGGDWEDVGGGSGGDSEVRPLFAAAPDASSSGGGGHYGGGSREQYGWLCDFINQFGEKEGFRLIEEKFAAESNQTARVMSALLLPLSGCAPLLVVPECRKHLSPCMEIAFKYAKNIGEKELKSKDINYLSDLCYSLKVLCRYIWPQHVGDCDKVRLEIIHQMLRTPHFNCRMNGLREVSRLIEEAEQNRTKNAISTEAVLEWMSENKILSVVLEGNIDQVQYTDRIKAIVEFLGPRLSLEELTNIWNLGEEENSHVMDNVHGVLAAASGKFSLTQFDLLNRLIKEKWHGAGERIRQRYGTVGTVTF
jgi:ubiquitin carboxyl-terminal hydrolase 9/24